MIWWIPSVICFLVALIIVRNGKKKHSDLASGWAVVGIVIVILTLIGSLIVSGSVIANQKRLVEVGRDIGIVEERFVAIQETIQAYASKYPIEKGLIKHFNPAILLNLPEIKSDTFLMSQIELAVKYQNSIYKFRLKANTIKRCLEFHQERWFSPTFASPYYED